MADPWRPSRWITWTGQRNVFEVTPPPPATIGSGVLKLVMTGIRRMTPRVRAYELRAPDWSDLPPVTAGAHLTVRVRLPEGSVVTRQYSLAARPHQRDLYEIAVLREESGRGGSNAIHAHWQIGTRLALDRPANQFPLHDDDRPAVLIAGGIGITPIKAMAMRSRHAAPPSNCMHYSGRTAADMAYRNLLARGPRTKARIDPAF